jgi:hypothetical protein
MKEFPYIATPFAGALGPKIFKLHPGIRAHFVQQSRHGSFRGTMRQIWRRRGWQGFVAWPFLWFSSQSGMLAVGTGRNVPFEITHTVTPTADGRLEMTWERRFYFPGSVQQFLGVMVFDSKRNVLVDWLGHNREVEVELHPSVDGTGIRIRSGRQWRRLGKLKVPIPRWLAGEANVHEWPEPDGSLGIRVTIHNPLLGDFFGYEGRFQAVEEEAVSADVPEAVLQDHS